MQIAMRYKPVYL